MAQQEAAAEKLRILNDEPAVPVWCVVDNYTLREWGEKGCKVVGVFLDCDEAVQYIRKIREDHKDEGPLLPIDGEGEFTSWDYSEWDEEHHYEIEVSEIKSIIKEDAR